MPSSDSATIHAPNPFDNVRAAGRRYIAKQDESADQCLVDPERPPTPPKVAQYKTSTVPGSRNIHPAYRVNMPDFTGVVFGDVAAGGSNKETAAATLSGMRMSSMQAEINAKVEERSYLSVKREPLGKPYVAGDLVLPAKTRDPRFAFGVKGASSDESAKDVIFPQFADPEDEKKEEIYQKSHRSFAPGMQRRFAVDWNIAGVDPIQKRFGKPMVSLEKNLVGKCLNPKEDPKENNRTILVPKVVDTFRALEDYQLGETRSKTLTDKSRHPEVYGKPAQRSEVGEWGAADCLQGDATTENQATDYDLGRAVSLGYRNVGLAVDPARRFGVPSIRTDVPKRDGGSVATTTDFGDGPSAAQLLFPGPYAGNGISEDDFMMPRSRSWLRNMFNKIGYAMSDAEFEVFYHRAATYGKITPLGAVCVQEFREVVNEVLSARDAGEEPVWFTQAIA